MPCSGPCRRAPRCSGSARRRSRPRPVAPCATRPTGTTTRGSSCIRARCRPLTHLALDQVLAEEVGDGRRAPTLRFWEWNQPAVVIGSFQSVKNEVDVENAERYGFQTVRRISGGGAMFMDADSVVTYSIYAPARARAGHELRRQLRLLRRVGGHRPAQPRNRGDLPAAQRHREPGRQDRRRRAEAARQRRRAAPRDDGLRHGRRPHGRGAAHRPREAQRQGHQVARTSASTRCAARPG